MLYTTTFRRPETLLPTEPTGHQPGCKATWLTLVGLYSMAECSCRLDPQAPSRHYRYQLGLKAEEAWFGHFSCCSVLGGSDAVDPGDTPWQDLELGLTHTAVDELFDAIRSGLFNFIEVWYQQDDDTILTLFVGVNKLSPDEDDNSCVVYPIVVICEQPFSADKMFQSPPRGEPVEPVVAAVAPVAAHHVIVPAPERRRWYRDLLVVAVVVAVVIAFGIWV